MEQLQLLQVRNVQRSSDGAASAGTASERSEVPSIAVISERSEVPSIASAVPPQFPTTLLIESGGPASAPTGGQQPKQHQFSRPKGIHIREPSHIAQKEHFPHEYVGNRKQPMEYHKYKKKKRVIWIFHDDVKGQVILNVSSLCCIQILFTVKK